MAPLFVLYGSATGNAEHIAKDLASKYPSNGSGLFDSVVCAELDQFKRKKCLDVWKDPPPSADDGGAKKHGLVVVCSTTGNGDPPENANRFVRHIKRKTTSPTTLQHVCYAVLGLGDTNYDQFCASGKLIDKKLGDIGGTRAMKVGMADEATGLEDVVEPWCEKVFAELERACRGESKEGGGGGKDDGGTPEEEKKAEAPPTTEGPKARPQAPPAAAEKKEDVAPQPPKKQQECDGVRLIKSLLGATASAAIPSVPPSSLPSLGPSLSSCELVAHDNDHENENAPVSDSVMENLDRMTLSTASTNAAHYNLNHPYESRVLGARYLTETDGGAAREAAEALGKGGVSEASDAGPMVDSRFEKALECFEKAFPLSGPGEAAQYDKNSKRVVELTLSLPDDFTLEYSPGDSIGLIVPNSVRSVAYVLNMLEECHRVKRTGKVKVDGDDNAITVEKAIRSGVDLDTPLCSRGAAQARRTIRALAEFVASNGNGEGKSTAEAEHAKEESAALLLLSSKTPDGERLFSNYIEQQRITPVDLLRDFPSTRAGATLHNLLAVLPGQVPPRYYSVSSSPLATTSTEEGAEEKSLTVAFSVVDYLTPPCADGGRRRVGGVATRYLEALCSAYLGSSSSSSPPSLSSPPTVKIFPKPTQEFRLPPEVSSSSSKPLILIGPGTGVAPFVGFLRHIRALRQQAKERDQARSRAAKSAAEGTWRGGFELEEDEVRVGEGDAGGLVPALDYHSKNKETVAEATAATQTAEDNARAANSGATVELYFGCRHKSHDWLYRSEMRDFLAEGTLWSLTTVFSREGTDTIASPDGTSKPLKYVQDAMRYDPSKRERLASAVVEQGGRVYVCGDGNDMARDVQEAVAEVLADKLGGNVEKGKFYLTSMKEEGRFVMDIWS